MKADNENHPPHQTPIESFEDNIAPPPPPNPEPLIKPPYHWTEIAIGITIIAAAIMAIIVNIAQTPKIT